jgi:hypothetical protein
VKLADAGLEPPALTVTVALKGGKKVTALIGNKKGDDEYYVKTPEAPQVFVVKKYNADRVMKRPIEFRDKTLCDIADSDVAEIAVSHGDNSYTIAKSGSDWKASKPAKLDVDSSKVTFARAFKEWKAQSFAEDATPKTNGLAKPRRRSSPRARQGRDLHHQGRRRDQGQAQLLRDERQGPDVYLAPKWNVDRVLVKLDDLKKAARSAAPRPAPVAAKPQRTEVAGPEVDNLSAPREGR